jgi:hypothetical protein
MSLWRRVRDFYITLRTEEKIAERECRHDRSQPQCVACIQDEAGW